MNTNTNYLIKTENYQILQNIDSSEIPEISRGARIAFHEFIEVKDEDKKYIGQEKPTDEIGHHKYDGRMVKNNERYPTSLKERVTTLHGLKEKLANLNKNAQPENRCCFLKTLLTTAILSVLIFSGYGFVTNLVADSLWFIAYQFPAMFSLIGLIGVNTWHVQNTFCKVGFECETNCCLRNTIAVIAATVFPPLAIGLPIYERYFKAEKLKSDIKENEALIVKTLDTYKKLIGQDVKEKIQEKMKTVLEETNKTVEENNNIKEGKLKLVTGQVQYNNLVEAWNTIVDLEKFFKKFEIQK